MRNLNASEPAGAEALCLLFFFDRDIQDPAAADTVDVDASTSYTSSRPLHACSRAICSRTGL